MPWNGWLETDFRTPAAGSGGSYTTTTTVITYT
jgi:hypothetical protein